MYQLDTYAVRLVKDFPVFSTVQIHSPEDAVRLVINELKDYDREHFVILMLKSDCSIIGLHYASMGSIDATIVSPRELMKTVLLANTSKVILFHNHPSSSLSPSKDDVRVTQRLIDVFSIFQIEILDHIIVGGGKPDFYFSFKEKGVMPTSKICYDGDLTHVSFVAEGGYSLEYTK